MDIIGNNAYSSLSSPISFFKKSPSAEKLNQINAQWKIAVETCNVKEMIRLLEEGVTDVDYRPDRNQLSKEKNASSKDPELISKFKGKNVHYQNPGDQALIRILNVKSITEEERKKIVKSLLKKDANPNLQGSFCTPLELAAINGQEDIVRIMVKHLKNKKQLISSKKVLFYAIKYKHENIIKYLIDKNVNLTDVDDSGNTILGQVVLDKDEDVSTKLNIIKTLLARNKFLQTNQLSKIKRSKNKDGLTAKSLAEIQRSSATTDSDKKIWKKIIKKL